uniref:BTB domain-containing protein n=1 Tax=Ditylenchus dipsaci TaxID=166011 RepID=A0A915CZX6_9BILA
MGEWESLQTEIAELKARLVAADQEKAQAGELGLHLEYETTKVELDKTKTVLSKFRDQHKVVTDSELDHEEGSAKLEAHYSERIAGLETEVKSLHEQLDRYKLRQRAERKHFKDELKELKNREQLLLNDNNELEEENVTLQKQVSNLKSAQIEFEAMKMEISRLLEETVLLQSSADEANKLRSLAEKQEQEALAAAQQEREQRIALKKEYERLRNDEHISNLNNLFNGIKDASEENDHSTLKQLESSIICEGPIESHGFPGPGKSTDLFSEIHGGLSDKVGELEAEKEQLAQKIVSLHMSFVQMVTPLFASLEINGNFADGCDLSRLKEFMELAKQKLDERLKPSRLDKATEKQVEQLKADLRQAILFAGQKNAKLSVAQDRMVNLSNNLYQFYSEISGGDQTAENRRQVTEIMHNLRKIAEEQAEKDGSTASGGDANASDRTNSPPTGGPSEEGETVSELDRDAKSPRLLPSLNLSRSIISNQFLKDFSSKLHSVKNVEEILSESDFRDKFVQEEDDLKKVSDSLHSLLRIVKIAAEATIQSKMAMEDKDKAEIYQNNTKLKQLLAVKREQVSSLRTVLRSNKTTTEGALQSLRDKFESEKRLKDEAMEGLRRELKQFKEDAATFASHRAMFTARCEELQGQVESVEGSFKRAEEEKRTLNELLRMSIQQKLTLTQRLEDVEMERERQTQAFKRPIRHGQNQQNNMANSKAVKEFCEYLISSESNASESLQTISNQNKVFDDRLASVEAKMESIAIQTDKISIIERSIQEIKASVSQNDKIKISNGDAHHAMRAIFNILNLSDGPDPSLRRSKSVILAGATCYIRVYKGNEGPKMMDLTLCLLGSYQQFFFPYECCTTKASKGFSADIAWSELVNRRNGFVDHEGNFAVSAEFTIKTTTNTEVLSDVKFLNPAFVKSDCTLIVNGYSIAVNKGILSAYSVVFDKMFFGEFREKSEDKVDLKGVSAVGFLRLLEAIYSSPTNNFSSVDAKDVECLLRLADFYQVEIVMQRCVDFLKKCSNTVVPLVKKLLLAQNYRRSDLLDFCISQFKTLDDSKNIMASDEYALLNTDVKSRILENVVKKLFWKNTP